MATEPKPPMSVYLSYAQKDQELKEEFEEYLVILQQAQLISGWEERQVRQGRDWSQVIDPRVFFANMFLLLVSPSLLASGYCSGAEFREMFERRQPPRKAVLIPILLHPVNLTGNPLGSIMPLPMRGIPVSSWPQRQEAWWSIDQGVREVIQNYLWGHW